jgi:hypothetical protein
MSDDGKFVVDMQTKVDAGNNSYYELGVSTRQKNQMG